MHHAKGHGTPIEGFRRRETYILEHIILAAPWRSDYKEARGEAGRTAPRGRKGGAWLKGRGAIQFRVYVLAVEPRAPADGLDVLKRKGEACGIQLIHV